MMSGSESPGGAEKELVVRRLYARSLLRPILMGAGLLGLPLWAFGLVVALLNGVMVNGEHITGSGAVLAALLLGPCFALITGLTLWGYVSACLWAYSKWSGLRLRYEPR